MNNPMSLAGSTVMVTGAAQGIGQATAEQAYSLGASLVLVDTNAEALASVAAGFEPSRVAVHGGSVTDAAFLESVISAANSRFGGVHGLVNNAGIIRPAMIEKMTEEQWRQVIEVNLTGAYLCVQAFGRAALERVQAGDTTPRSIVSISSDAGRMGSIGQINYSAAKSGLFGITMSAAREWAKHGIRANAICFGLVETQMTETIRSDKFRERVLSRIPMGRWSSPAEAATPICFFLSQASSYITGQVISVDGGSYMGA